MRIAVIGTGYLGAVHAVGMTAIGHHVVGADIDTGKIASLAGGRAPFYEPEFPELLATALDSGRLCFTTSLTDAAAAADVVFICVGTPQVPGSDRADMRFVDAVVDAIGPHLDADALVVGKSTVPVGTAARLQHRLNALRAGLPPVEVAWNPEFLREGFAVADTLNPDRIVVGATSDRAVRIVERVYAPLRQRDIPFINTDLATAELVKVAANSFLATKISFINAMAEVCETVGADVTTLAGALGHDQRIGPLFLRSGVGFGGGCLGKDIRAFRARGTELGAGDALAFLGEVDAINTRRRQRTVDLAAQMLGGSVDGRRITVLGAAFKPNSDDVRDSPALWVAQALHQAGAAVTVHDPEAIDNAKAATPQLTYRTELLGALDGAELLVHLTEWDAYRQLEPAEAAGVVAAPRLLDARNALPAQQWLAAGWQVEALGRSLSGGSPENTHFDSNEIESIIEASEGVQYA